MFPLLDAEPSVGWPSELLIGVDHFKTQRKHPWGQRSGFLGNYPVTSSDFWHGLRARWSHSALAALQQDFQELFPRLPASSGGLAPLGAAYLVGGGLNDDVHITRDLPHVADLEPSLGLMTHQDVAEDELVLVLHKEPPTLYGLEDVDQSSAAADLVLLKYHGTIVGHKGWGEGDTRPEGPAPAFCTG